MSIFLVVVRDGIRDSTGGSGTKTDKNKTNGELNTSNTKHQAAVERSSTIQSNQQQRHQIMPLHEYLETKRRQNIRELNAAKACHICGSSSRHTGGLSRLIAHDDESVSSQGSDEIAGMRTCGCFGFDYPYSLRVCDMCIKDDATSLTGRIRHCGICGVVACDEDCGVELVECTDVEGWNNAGEFATTFDRGSCGSCLCCNCCFDM